MTDEQFLAAFESIKTEIHQGNQALRTEMHAGNQALRSEIQEGHQALRTEMLENNRVLRAEMHENNQALRTEMHELNDKTLQTLRGEMGHLKDEMIQVSRDMQTEVIRYMGNLAEQFNIRMRHVEANAGNMETAERLRLASLEERMLRIEKKFLGNEN